MQEKLILTDLTEKELLGLYNKVIKHIEYLNGSIISLEEEDKNERS